MFMFASKYRFRYSKIITFLRCSDYNRCREQLLIILIKQIAINICYSPVAIGHCFGYFHILIGYRDIDDDSIRVSVAPIELSRGW